jgi:hypothetical protein
MKGSIAVLEIEVLEDGARRRGKESALRPQENRKRGTVEDQHYTSLLLNRLDWAINLVCCLKGVEARYCWFAVRSEVN